MRKLNQRGGEGIAGGKGEQLSRNMDTGHMDKAKVGRIEGRRWGQVRGGMVGGKWRQLYLNSNFKK